MPHLPQTVDVVLAGRDVDGGGSEDPLAARLGGVELGHLGLRGQDGDVEGVGHGQVVAVRHSRHDEGLPAADQVGNALEGARGILQYGRQAHAVSLGDREKGPRSIKHQLT